MTFAVLGLCFGYSAGDYAGSRAASAVRGYHEIEQLVARWPHKPEVAGSSPALVIMTTDQLQEYIKKRVATRSRQRRAFSIYLMVDYPGYDCKVCIHGISNSCRDHLPNGCQKFSDIKTGRKFELDDKTLKRLFKRFLKAS